MVGITSYGAYIPIWRLAREVISKEWGFPGAPGEKAVANFDEDSLTMGVAAALDCLNGFDRTSIDGAFFATTTSPFLERQAAVTMAAATDLRRDILTSDFSDSLRAGTQAMRAAADAVKAGTAKSVLVAAADTRMPPPRSQFEMLFGDAAAAVIIGDKDVAVEIQGFHTMYHEISDVWRANKDDFVKAWEDRFVIEEGFLRAFNEAVADCMKKYKCKPADFAKIVSYAPDYRWHTQLAKRLKIDESQLQDGLFGFVGLTGCAHPLLMLVGALESAKPGDKILLISYGNGIDIFILQVTEHIEKIRSRKGLSGHLMPKRNMPDYATYAQWRGIVSAEAAARRPASAPPSSSALWRERDRILRLHGGKCKNCGTLQYPPQRVCTRCRGKDNFETVRFSDKKAKLFTYSLDYIAGSMDVPLAVCIVNFEGGGRMLCTMTDRDVSEIQVDMPLEMSFRRVNTIAGVPNYFWKCIPVRS
ncbi:MAG: hydroxymethylglutaryl-CoA synthase family protein [Candidatus Abyssobacteria bacterium SURF_17]|uniref:Hydroxymethylglutaryl-CoA synthase family protein n=1 Tax=Candidatus Abyssobacteria bacterium SURF_17 TaxID=2093361 RepID=A0A419F0Z8_9BACT|nr:MAG: hydroxymethylglutaryl-CoA synthase family protein [Candidatus Abyssubacteria bacterium SURF_17]